MDLTTASYFSGVGGMDMGLEAAGWRTVSFSEIEPYACSILAQTWPEVPNLGCIKTLAGYLPPHGHDRDLNCVVQLAGGGGGGPIHRGTKSTTEYDQNDSHLGSRDDRRLGTSSGTSGLRSHSDTERVQPAPYGESDGRRRGQLSVTEGLGCGLCGAKSGHGSGCPNGATLWTGGFPCQDLSVAGKRRGMGAGTRSGLAFAFLDLAERYRPPLILLENVPGLLSSHQGKDMAVLLGTMVELGYGVGYRILDARYFGVPQRRRRVFIVGVKADRRAGAERAAEILSVGSRCQRHPAARGKAGTVAASGIGHSVTGTSGKRHDTDTDTDTDTLVRTTDYSDGSGTPYGLARGPYDPPKQDSHRYRCCGNGVVSNVAEWLGMRLREEAERA